MEALSDKELVNVIDTAIANFTGVTDQLENAIGALMFGRQVGWRPLFLIHSQKSIRTYEGILTIRFQEVLPEVGAKADKLNAWRLSKQVSNFWKLVKGEVPNVRTPDWKIFK